MDPRREVAELRQEIAKLDENLVELLNARARISRKIHGWLEGEPGADVSDREWLERLVSLSAGDLPAESLLPILGQVRAAGRALEQPVKIAYLGPEGGFCHLMAEGYFGHGTSYVECATVESVLEEVTRRRAIFAAFPFESSVEGLVQSSVTALAATELVMVAERILVAEYGLLSTSGKMENIEMVYTTGSARVACQRLLDHELSRATVIDVRSPVLALQLAREDNSGAAIVPVAGFRTDGLEVVRSSTGDSAGLKIRFAIASLRPASRSGNDVTCLLFSAEDSPGALFDVLKHFAERGVNLRKLHSRPAQRGAWEYVFYVEISGHITDRPVVTALEFVKRSTKYLRVLGSFPVMGEFVVGSR